VSRGSAGGPVGLSSRTRHELDRAGVRLRERFAYRPARRRVPSERWRWSDERAQVVEQGVRELLADAARHHQAGRLEPRAARLLEQARDLLGAAVAAGESAACAWCGGPMPGGSASRGAVLQEGLSAGVLPGTAEGSPRPVWLPAARYLQLVWRADARRPASRGAVLRQELPPGLLEVLAGDALRRWCRAAGPGRHVARSGAAAGVGDASPPAAARGSSTTCRG
jgi:hypothetical protein